jgi:hypothetical protein
MAVERAHKYMHTYIHTYTQDAHFEKQQQGGNRLYARLFKGRLGITQEQFKETIQLLASKLKVHVSGDAVLNCLRTGAGMSEPESYNTVQSRLRSSRGAVGEMNSSHDHDVGSDGTMHENGAVSHPNGRKESASGNGHDRGGDTDLVEQQHMVHAEPRVLHEGFDIAHESSRAKRAQEEDVTDTDSRDLSYLPHGFSTQIQGSNPHVLRDKRVRSPLVYLRDASEAEYAQHENVQDESRIQTDIQSPSTRDTHVCARKLSSSPMLSDNATPKISVQSLQSTSSVAALSTRESSASPFSDDSRTNSESRMYANGLDESEVSFSYIDVSEDHVPHQDHSGTAAGSILGPRDDEHDDDNDVLEDYPARVGDHASEQESEASCGRDHESESARGQSDEAQDAGVVEVTPREQAAGQNTCADDENDEHATSVDSFVDTSHAGTHKDTGAVTKDVVQGSVKEQTSSSNMQAQSVGAEKHADGKDDDDDDDDEYEKQRVKRLAGYKTHAALRPVLSTTSVNARRCYNGLVKLKNGPKEYDTHGDRGPDRNACGDSVGDNKDSEYGQFSVSREPSLTCSVLSLTESSSSYDGRFFFGQRNAGSGSGGLIRAVPSLCESSYTSSNGRSLGQRNAGVGGAVHSVPSMSESSYISHAQHDGLLGLRSHSVVDDLDGGVQKHMERLRAERTRTVSVHVCYMYANIYVFSTFVERSEAEITRIE